MRAIFFVLLEVEKDDILEVPLTIKTTFVNSARVKSYLFFGIFFLFVVLSVGIAFYRYVIALDYFVFLHVPCDPSSEYCFVYRCDPLAETCSEDPKENVEYYSTVKAKAYLLNACVESDPVGCPQLRCLGEGEDCLYTKCDPNTVTEEGPCYGPEEYREENETAEPSD